jgi:hypothetical protein
MTESQIECEAAYLFSFTEANTKELRDSNASSPQHTLLHLYR